MRAFTFSASAVALPLCAALAQAAVIQSTFDTDLEGWVISNTLGAQWQAAGGNPGGYAHIDNTEQQIAFMFAPPAFLGDLSAYNGQPFSFDAIQIEGGGSPWDNFENFGRLRITGVGGTVSADLVPGTTGPGASWTTYSIPFTAASFGVNDLTWSTLLTGVTEISLSVEGLFGNEVNGVDNVRLVPGPGAIVPGAMIAAGIAIRRRRDR